MRDLTDEEYGRWRYLTAQRDAKMKHFETLTKELMDLNYNINLIEQKYPRITEYRLPQWLIDAIDETDMGRNISHI